jgi:cupin fold WbuC family metalloprotein
VSMRKSLSEFSVNELLEAKRASVTRLRGDVIRITPGRLDELKEMARQSPLQRARYCLHSGDDAAVQEMIIALTENCYVRPHRHRTKAETFCILEGEMDVILLDAAGRELERIVMGLAKSGETPVYRLAPGYWHAVVPLSGTVVFCETSAGPFDRSDTEFPDWSPKETDAIEAADFISRLRKSD